MDAFPLLWDALKSTQQILIATLQILLVITIILSIILFYAERSVQSKEYNFRKSLLWSFTRYIDDPGNLSTSTPKTSIGRIIATIIGVLGILIVAVPAGVIGSGFTEAINNRNTLVRIEENREKLKNIFERKLDRPSGFQVVSFFRPLADLQSKTGMTENDIFETVNNSPDFRIINLASTVPLEENAPDRLAVEQFPLNRSYGSFIDRGSQVTIVAPSSYTEPTVGVFSFYVALIGGFNYISHELGDRIVYKSVHYVDTSRCFDTEEREYFKDLVKLMSRPNSWSFDILASSGSNEIAYETEVHLGIGNEKGKDGFDNPNLLVKDTIRYKEFYKEFSIKMENDFGILVDQGKYHSTSNENIWPRILNIPSSSNSVVVRIAWSAMLWNDNRLLIAKALADCINNSILGISDPQIPESLKQKDFGYNGYDL